MGNKARRVVSLVLVVGLFFQQAGLAQAAGALSLAGYLNLSGSSALSQDRFRPVQMRYFSYEPDSDNFKILLDKGGLNKLEDKNAKEEAQTLLSYFLVGVSLPDDVFWVNLRPDFQDRIIDPLLEKTEVGRIMLEADLQLKKDTSRMTSPQTPEGKAYWDKLYKKAGELFGTENITIPTITRPWIVPGEIIVRESQNSAYVYKAGLKVMLEEDYLSRGGFEPAPTSGGSRTAPTHQQYAFSDPRLKELNQYSTQLIKELIIPKLTKEINSSKRYANLRQVYYSLILSRWFKLRFSGKSGSYASLINTRNLTNLTSQKPWDKSEYFNQYQQSFSKGEYNLKEQVATPMGQIARSYVSGGLNWASSAINPENGVVLKGDVSNAPGMIEISGSANSPLGTGLQTNVAGSFDPTPTSSPVSSPEILFFGGSAVGFYAKALKNFKLVHAITPFDGGLVLNDGENQLLSNIEDNPSSSGWLRASVEEDLPAPGDITSIIIKRSAEDPKVPYYKKDILEARFTRNYVEYAGLKQQRPFNNFSDVITFIAPEYRKDKKPNDLAKDSGFTDFMRQVKEYADEIKMPAGALFWNSGDGNKELRHSIKNLIFYAILKKNSNRHDKYEKSLLEFAKLAGGGKAALEDIMFSSYDLNGVELVAKVGEAGEEEYLCGQEEITQNLTEKPIKELFFATREEVKDYVKQRKNIAGANIFRLPKVNPQLQKKIKDIEERNKEESRNKNFIVFGPGSQFSSVLLHLKIPGVISALAEATHTPRVLVLNPIKDYETSGINEKDYFKEIVDTIEKWIQSELKDDKKNISAIFDFIMVNDKVQNDMRIEENAKTPPNATNIARGKKRHGLIKYDIDNIKNQLKDKSVILVTGNLLEVADGKISYSVGVMEELFKAMQKFYVQRHQGNSDLGHRGGVLLAADLHATLNAALRVKLAFPDAPLLVVGDPSDRGHNLHRLLRLTDSFVSGDHELWAVGMASGVSDYLTAMYLRMAFSYENDDLLDDLGLGKILEKALDQQILKDWETIGYLKKELSSPQKAGKFFNYIFSKIYFEEMCNKFYKENSPERQKALEKLFLVLAYAYHPDKRIFQLEDGFGKKLDKILGENKESFNPGRLNKLREKLKKIKDEKALTEEEKAEKTRIEIEISEAEKKIVGQIENGLKDDFPKDESGNINLLTESEKKFFGEVKDIISKKLKGPDAPDSLKSLIGHFLKGPIYREVQIGPQIPRTEKLSQVRFIDPDSEQKVLLMHVLPPMVQDGSGLADMLGNTIRLDRLKEYYDKLNKALQTLRELFLKGELTSETELFAGYDEDGEDKKIKIDEWFIRISDTIYAPLFAREHRRIEAEYINKGEKEPDNIIYDLLYKGKVDNKVRDKLIDYFKSAGLDLKPEDFNKDEKGNIKAPEKIVQAVLKAFGQADMLVVGHKKIQANQVVSLANGKLVVLDAEFADKGGVTGALEHTQQGAALLRSDKGKARVVNLINMQQVFLENKADFAESFVEDSNFKELGKAENIDYYLLEEVRKEIIKNCGLRDIHYYNISISPEDIRQAFNIAIGNSLDEFRKNNHGSLTIVGELMDILKEDNRNVNLSTFDEFMKALKEKGIQALNRKTIEGLLPKSSVWRLILENKPQEFLLPVIVAEKTGNSMQYKIIRVDDKAGSIAYYTLKDGDGLLDKLLAPGQDERMDNGQPTLDNADFRNGSMLDDIPIEDIQSYIERVNGNLYSLKNNRGKPLTTDDLKPAREKFGPDGKVLPFKGLTTIAWIEKNTPLYEQLKSAQESISRELLSTTEHPIFAPVAPASLHMTIYDLITGGLNGKEDISAEKYQEIYQKVKEAFEEILGIGNINMEVKGVGTFPLKPNLLMAKCYPKTQEDLNKILQIRRKIEDKTGIKSQFPLVAHITLGYVVNSLSVEEYGRFLDVMEKYNYQFGAFTFSNLDFTHFSDMNNFIPVLTKDLSILQDVLRASKMLVNTNLEAVSSEVNESVALFSNYLQELKVSLEKKGINLEQYIRIDTVINGIREDRGKESKKTKFVKKLKGELVDIVDENDLQVEVTEAGFTHIFGLRHRTANAFVFTPDGKLFLQRRVHNKAEAKTFSIAGGHVVHGMTYAEAADEELLQELKLYQIEEKLEGKLILIGQEGQFRNDDAKSPNNEFRSLYAYVLTEKEWAHVKNMKNEIDVERAKRTETEFEKWIEEEQKKPEDGLGEVWGYHVVELSEVINSENVHVTEKYSDGLKKQDVGFSKDLLLPLANGIAPIRDGTQSINPMQEIKDKLRLSSASLSTQFSNSEKDIYIPKSVDEAYDAVIMTLTEIMKDYNIFKPNIDKDKVRKALSSRDAICIGSVFSAYDRSLYSVGDEVTVKFSEGMLVIGGIEDYHYGDTTRYKITRPFNEELLKNTLLTILHELNWVYNAVLTEEDKRTIELVEKRNFLAGTGTGNDNYMEEPGYLALQEAYSAVYEKMKTLTDAKITEIVNWVKSEPNKNLKGEDVYILKRTDLGLTIVGSIDRGIADKFGFTYESTSSPMQSLSDKKTGGIDFRALPMSIQPMGSFRGLDFGLPRLSLAEIERIDVESQIGQIKNMVSSGISPSGRRVKELVAACAQKGQISAYADDLLACIGDILKLEEEIAKESSVELKEALVLADLGGNYFQL